MKKILILTTVSGFLEKFEKDNVKILQELGYEVHYAANRNRQVYRYDEQELKNRGVQFYHIPIQKSPLALLKNTAALRQIVHIVKKEGISYIHCHTPMGGALGRLAGWICRHTGKHLKIIYTAHGFHFYRGAEGIGPRVFYAAERLLAHQTDVLITINREDYRHAKRFHLRPGGRVYRIPGVGLDTKAFSPCSSEARRQSREALGISENTIFLLSVGELSENKNHLTLLKMMDGRAAGGRSVETVESAGIRSANAGEEVGARANDAANTVCANIYLGICGDGPCRTELQRYIKEHDLEDAVTLYGYCSPVQPYLQAADVFLFPSQREGLGMAALEALAMGLPVIAADNRGTREYIRQGENGWRIPWDDADGYRRCLDRLLAMSGDERVRMRKACRESVRPFDRRRTARIMKEIYKSL